MIIAAFVMGIITSPIEAEEKLIPDWIKSIAGFWLDGEIGDKEFLAALQYLVKEEILVIPEPETQQEGIEQTESPAFEGGVITCDPYGTNSLKMDIWIQNPFDETVSVELVAMGTDVSGEVVTLNVFTMWDVLPGQKKYDTTYIDDDPRIDSCIIEIQGIR